MGELAEGRCYVGEGFAAEPGGWWSGRFDVHWESTSGRDHHDGPRDVSLEEAITWARKHADSVFVQVGGKTYALAAGDVDDDVAAWPWVSELPVVRARPIGTPLDGSMREADWVVTGEVDRPHLSDELWSVFGDEVSAADRVVDYAVDPEGSPSRRAFTVVYRAADSDTAIEAVDRLVRAVIRRLVPGRSGSAHATSCGPLRFDPDDN